MADRSDRFNWKAGDVTYIPPKKAKKSTKKTGKKTKK